MLDLGCFRIGGEEYATGDEATFGLATMRSEHVTLVSGAVRFCYPAKGGIQRDLDVRDAEVRAVVGALLRRRAEHPELLAYRAGRGWCDVRSTDINAYLREISGIDISAKDFRTWNGTVLAAVVLASAAEGGSAGAAEGRSASSAEGRSATSGKGRSAGSGAGRASVARRRAVGAAMREVSGYLGNTPAVARASYVDPRVVDLFNSGVTIAGALAELGGTPDWQDPAARQGIEAAVLEMLQDAPS